jgi:hypothetical protein
MAAVRLAAGAMMAAAVAAQDPVAEELWPIANSGTSDPCLDTAVSGRFGPGQCPVDCKPSLEAAPALVACRTPCSVRASEEVLLFSDRLGAQQQGFLLATCGGRTVC